MSLFHKHYSLTGQKPEAFVTNMFDNQKEAPEESKNPKLSRRTVPTNSHKIIRSYDHSSPTSSPPMSRRNSSSSINSTRSEPTWESDYSYDRRASVGGDRRSSVASNKSTSSQKSLKSLFHKKTKEEKEEQKKKTEKVILGSRHNAAVKTKMMLDPKYKEMREHHNQAGILTAGVRGTENSHHITAAEQEARHPHSGPPRHSTLSMPALTRIQSADEEDLEVDHFEQQRREWEASKQPEVHDIEENTLSRDNSATSPPTSGASSPRRTPAGSRESSPQRHSSYSSPRLNHRTKQTWGGGYRRNDAGVWTKKDVQILPLTPHHPNALAESIDKKLSVS